MTRVLALDGPTKPDLAACPYSSLISQVFESPLDQSWPALEFASH
jgi:hypothetical protein